MKKNIYIKLTLKNGKTQVLLSSAFIRRILATVSLVDFKKAYVKVSYGKKMCNLGCVCMFDNEGRYTNYKDLSYAIKVFWNE